MPFDYKIVEHIVTLSESGNTSKELNRISNNGTPPKWDLRTWMHTDGGEKLLKGITLTDAEIRTLREAIPADL